LINAKNGLHQEATEATILKLKLKQVRKIAKIFRKKGFEREFIDNESYEEIGEPETLTGVLE